MDVRGQAPVPLAQREAVEGPAGREARCSSSNGRGVGGLGVGGGSGSSSSSSRRFFFGSSGSRGRSADGGVALKVLVDPLPKPQLGRREAAVFAAIFLPLRRRAVRG